jgi:hypothetical protein
VLSISGATDSLLQVTRLKGCCVGAGVATRVAVGGAGTAGDGECCGGFAQCADFGGGSEQSARSLHRQLQEEGASLQQLKDEVRFEKAKELLLRTSKRTKQVAEASGFRTEKSFIRAFREWDGKPPRGLSKGRPRLTAQIVKISKSNHWPPIK